MNIKTKLVTMAAAGSILVAGVVGATGYATAQTPGAIPDTAKQQQRTERRDNFLGRVAAHLGVTLDQLKQAYKSAETQAVDDALAAGKITQAQADKAKARIESGNGAGLGKLLAGGHRRARARVERLRDGIITSAATALNMTPKELKAQLKSGKSIADVAGANLDAVKTQIAKDAKAKLDAAVAANKLTQAQADTALQKLTDSLDKILNKSRGAAPAPAAP